MRVQDTPFPTPHPADEWASGHPRLRDYDFPPVKTFNRSEWYVKNMGDDTPIQAYSLRDDYERNAEWYPTKTIRDWKTVDRNREYPPTDPYPLDYPRGTANEAAVHSREEKGPWYSSHNQKVMQPSTPQHPANVGKNRIPNATQHFWGTELPEYPPNVTGASQRHSMMFDRSRG